MFYDFTLHYTTKEKEKNELGQLVEKVFYGDTFHSDLQPISEALKVKEWGESSKGSYNLFSNAFLSIGDIVVYENRAYKVTDKKDWIDYRVYLLEQVDIKLWLK